MANEAVRWAEIKRKKLLLLKIDFPKAFDCLNWEFLDSTLMQMNFSAKWRRWIRGCLSSAAISISVNGSPTQEFSMQRGLRQGDPLSPFLFIIATEALHVMMMEANQKGIFKGACIGQDSIEITHLQFADDVLFFGEWSVWNVTNLLKCLKWFEAASGLVINLTKSRLLGVHVPSFEVSRLASSLHCSVGRFPFIYFGLLVGAKMKKIQS